MHVLTLWRHRCPIHAVTSIASRDAVSLLWKLHVLLHPFLRHRHFSLVCFQYSAESLLILHVQLILYWRYEIEVGMTQGQRLLAGLTFHMETTVKFIPHDQDGTYIFRTVYFSAWLLQSTKTFELHGISCNWTSGQNKSDLRSHFQHTHTHTHTISYLLVWQLSTPWKKPLYCGSLQGDQSSIGHTLWISDDSERALASTENQALVLYQRPSRDLADDWNTHVASLGPYSMLFH